MIRKALFAGLALVAFSVPTIAATQFYVAKSETTKKCEVVNQKPDGKTWMMVGKTSYKDKTAAEAAMKTASDCK